MAKRAGFRATLAALGFEKLLNQDIDGDGQVRSHSLSHAHTLSLTLTLSRSHTHTHSLSHTLSHTHTHTYTHTHTHTHTHTLLSLTGIDPNVGDYDLRTPLHVSVAEGHLLLTSTLLGDTVPCRMTRVMPSHCK